APGHSPAATLRSPRPRSARRSWAPRLSPSPRCRRSSCGCARRVAPRRRPPVWPPARPAETSASAPRHSERRPRRTRAIRRSTETTTSCPAPLTGGEYRQLLSRTDGERRTTTDVCGQCASRRYHTSMRDTWRHRLQRAEHLAADGSASVPLVAFYAALLRVQEDLYNTLSALPNWRPSGALDHDLPAFRRQLPAVLRAIATV